MSKLEEYAGYDGCKRYLKHESRVLQVMDTFKSLRGKYSDEDIYKHAFKLIAYESNLAGDLANNPIAKRLAAQGKELIEKGIIKPITKSYDMEELILYAGCDGWAAMLRHEWQIPQFPFISYRKLQNSHQL